MSFETLKDTILEEARAQAARVRDEYEEQVKSEETRITDKASRIEETIIEKAEAEGVRRARQRHQEAELRGRAAVLRAKQEELDVTKQELAKELTQLDGEQAKELIHGLLSILPDAPGTIVAGTAHAPLLREAASTHTIEDGDFEGGFVYRSSDSEIDLRIENLIDQLFVTHRAELAGILFS